MTDEDLLKIINDLRLECLGNSVRAYGKPIKKKGKLYKHGLAEAYADVAERLQKVIEKVRRQVRD